MMQQVAVRRYPLRDLRTGRDYPATDTLMRCEDGSFALVCDSGDNPSEPNYTEEGLNEFDAFAWLRSMPEQIDRKIVDRG